MLKYGYDSGSLGELGVYRLLNPKDIAAIVSGTESGVPGCTHCSDVNTSKVSNCSFTEALAIVSSKGNLEVLARLLVFVKVAGVGENVVRGSIPFAVTEASLNGHIDVVKLLISIGKFCGPDGWDEGWKSRWYEASAIVAKVNGHDDIHDFIYFELANAGVIV